MSEQGEGGEGMSVEDRASAVGWKSDGDLSAEEFIEKREDHVGLLRNDVKKLEQTLAESRSETKEIASMFKNAQAAAQKRGYEKAYSEIEERQKKAISEGDGEEFAKLNKAKAQLEKQEEEANKPEPQTNPVLELAKGYQQSHPEIFETRDRAEAWLKEMQYQVTTHGLKPDDAMRKAVSVVAEAHGLKRKQPGDLGEGGKSGGGKTFADLPDDAKQAYEKWKKQIPDFSKQDYADSYFSQEN